MQPRYEQGQVPWRSKDIHTPRLFMVFALFSLTTMLMMGYLPSITEKWQTGAWTVSEWTDRIPSPVISDLLALEIPYFSTEQPPSVLAMGSMIGKLLQFVTRIDPGGPETWISHELPGMMPDTGLLAYQGNGREAAPGDEVPSNTVSSSAGSGSSNEADSAQSNFSTGEGLAGEGSEAEGWTGDAVDRADTVDLEHGAPESWTDAGAEHAGTNPGAATEPEQAGTNVEMATEPEQAVQAPAGEGPVVAFIYHSHNRESWLPELKGKTQLSEAFDAKINVTLLGDRLAERLDQKGIGAISSNKDYSTEVSDYNWNFSYKYSLQTVREAFAVHPDLNYYFDIHRDSQKRELTTATLDGVDYAQIYFIIGRSNPHWEENEQFAEAIQERLEKDYPGLSRGVWGKTPSSGNAEYNQSFSSNSILIEIGGPENTLEECYRTVDILGETIAEVIKQQMQGRQQASVMAAANNG